MDLEHWLAAAILVVGVAYGALRRPVRCRGCGKVYAPFQRHRHWH